MPKGIELLTCDWLITYLHVTSKWLDGMEVNIVTSQQEGCEFESSLWILWLGIPNKVALLNSGGRIVLQTTNAVA